MAIVLVVIGHSTYLGISSTFGNVSYQLPENINAIYYSKLFYFWQHAIDWIYGFHMPLFFILSGAVLALHPEGSFDTLFKTKVRRLVFPYFLAGWFFVLPVKRWANYYDNITFKQALWGFLSGQEESHLWTLLALFWCILIFSILNRLLERVKVKSAYGLLLACGTIHLLFPRVSFDILMLKQGMGYFFYFGLGYCFEQERQKTEPWNGKTTVLALTVLAVLNVASIKYGVLNSFFKILCGSFLIYLLSDICTRVFLQLPENRIWRVLIRNLFYIYLFHDPLEYVILRISMEHSWLETAIGCLLYAFARTVGVFLISMVLGELVRWGKSVSKRLLLT